MNRPPLYPLTFAPILSERPWGGDALRTLLGKDVPNGVRVGESWEIYSTSVIDQGPLTGMTLRDALREYWDALGPRDGDDFPLLVKFLDANDWLSVQVHPDDALAKELENQPRGKTECWYVVHAEPGAQIAFGTAREMTADEFRGAVESGQAKATVAYIPIQTGDFIYVRARTIHALGPGLLIYELQQSSDLTYRVYDWDRVGKDGKPRELHLEKALRVAEFQPRPDAKIAYQPHADASGNEVATLTRSPYFALDKLRLNAPATTFDTAGVCRLLTVIDGTLQIGDLVLPKGRSSLIPASYGKYTLAQNGGAEVLLAWPQ